MFGVTPEKWLLFLLLRSSPSFFFFLAQRPSGALTRSPLWPYEDTATTCINVEPFVEVAFAQFTLHTNKQLGCFVKQPMLI